MNNFREKAGIIWSVADLLRGDYKQSEYGKLVLPLTVLRRLDCVLEPTKQKVLEKAKALPKNADEKMKDVMLGHAAGQKFDVEVHLHVAAPRPWMRQQGLVPRGFGVATKR